jgi:hypothetical protein
VEIFPVAGSASDDHHSLALLQVALSHTLALCLFNGVRLAIDPTRGGHEGNYTVTHVTELMTALWDYVTNENWEFSHESAVGWYRAWSGFCHSGVRLSVLPEPPSSLRVH